VQRIPDAQALALARTPALIRWYVAFVRSLASTPALIRWYVAFVGWHSNQATE